ncbi:hypothetical protein BSLG_006631 [Batrachochytrium salamandrivorans]|nr:hypothetical protein BSLG_006631 [Batrachochytrium salamandrivorans]
MLSTARRIPVHLRLAVWYAVRIPPSNSDASTRSHASNSEGQRHHGSIGPHSGNDDPVGDDSDDDSGSSFKDSDLLPNTPDTMNHGNRKPHSGNDDPVGDESDDDSGSSFKDSDLLPDASDTVDHHDR